MVTRAFQPDNDVSDTFAVYKTLSEQLDDIKRLLTQDATIDVDEYAYEPANTVLTITPRLRVPWICTSVLATWTAGNSVVVIQIGDRYISNGSNAVKNLNFDCKMQIGPHDPIILTSSVSGALFLELMGSADYRKIDRQDNV